MQLPNNGAQRTEHPLTDHFGPFPLQQVAVLHRELAEVDASFGPPRFLSADALRPRVQGCLAARPSCVHLTESTGPSSSFRLAERPSCVHLTKSTDPSISFRLAARPSCVHLTESTSPSSSFVPRPLEQPRSVGGDCEGIGVVATAKQWCATHRTPTHGPFWLLAPPAGRGSLP